MEILFHSRFDLNTVTATKFCTWHDSCAVVACAKICCDLMADSGITPRRIFHRIWIAGKQPLVKLAPDCVMPFRSQAHAFSLYDVYESVNEPGCHQSWDSRQIGTAISSSVPNLGTYLDNVIPHWPFQVSFIDFPRTHARDLASLGKEAHCTCNISSLAPACFAIHKPAPWQVHWRFNIIKLHTSAYSSAR